MMAVFGFDSLRGMGAKEVLLFRLLVCVCHRRVLSRGGP